MENNLKKFKFQIIKDILEEYILLYKNNSFFDGFDLIFDLIENLNMKDLLLTTDDHFIFKCDDDFITIDDMAQYILFASKQNNITQFVTIWPLTKEETFEKTLVIDNFIIANKKIEERLIFLINEDEYHIRLINRNEKKDLFTTTMPEVMDNVEENAIKEQVRIIEEVTFPVKTKLLKKEK